MTLKQDFSLMAQYNQWMNERMFAAAAELDDAELQADRGAFFGSILATLGHVHAADIHWLKRFATDATELSSLEPVRSVVLPPLVRGITRFNFVQLREDRAVLDAVIVAFTDEADDAVYARTLRYSNSAGERYNKVFGLVLRHFFNHQTHHRGQVTTLFSQMGVDVGATDLSVLIPEV